MGTSSESLGWFFCFTSSQKASKRWDCLFIWVGLCLNLKSDRQCITSYLKLHCEKGSKFYLRPCKLGSLWYYFLASTYKNWDSRAGLDSTVLHIFSWLVFFLFLSFSILKSNHPKNFLISITYPFKPLSFISHVLQTRTYYHHLVIIRALVIVFKFSFKFPV